MLKYYEIMRNSKDKKLLRLKMVLRAEEIGIKATTAEYKCSVNTVRKWYRRYKLHGNSGLEEESRRPHKCRCLSESDISVILKSKARYKPFGAARLKEVCNLPYSVKTINKILREAGLTKRRRKKSKRKNNLRSIKATWKLFQQIQVDTKHLYDIPEYWPYIHTMKFPKYQYTARDATSGLLFKSFAHELSISNSKSFIEELAEHLKKSGADISETTIQTDNGSEFIGAWNAKSDSAFTKAVEKHFKQHITIKPKAHTWQADVETAHNLIETEFYEIETFKNIDHLLRKMSTYLLWFNFLRKNSYKEKKTPLQIAIEKQRDIKNCVVKFKTTILDYNIQLTYKEDHHVGGAP